MVDRLAIYFKRPTTTLKSLRRLLLFSLPRGRNSFHSNALIVYLSSHSPYQWSGNQIVNSPSQENLRFVRVKIHALAAPVTANDISTPVINSFAPLFLFPEAREVAPANERRKEGRKEGNDTHTQQRCFIFPPNPFGSHAR